MGKLSDKDKNRIIQILESGNLPLDYKYILFPPEKKEYELVYAGKEREEDILADTISVPLQPVKTFGTNGNGWTNRLIFGDNLQAMKSLLDDPEVKGQVKLIYIDPPFGTGDQYDAKGDIPAYSAKMQGVKFVAFLRKRLFFLKELLSKEGCLFIRIDYHFGHYIKMILDEIFGKNNFRNEIIVKRGQSKAGFFKQFEKIRSIAVSYDTLFWYSKNPDSRFLKIKKDATIQDQNHGKWMNLIKAKAYKRPTMQYEILGIKKDAPWMWSKERSYKAIENYNEFLKKRENLHISLEEYWDDSGKALEFVRRKGNQIQYWIPPRDSVLVDNNWLDIKGYSHITNYPTENSEELLYRILQITEKGDLVLDAFAGSGATLAVSEKLDRRWIGIDCGKLAMYTIQKRMLNLKTEIGNKGKRLKAKPFTLYSAGLYDFKQLRKLPWEGWRKFALLLFNCRDKKHKVGGVELDGFRGNSDALVFNHLKDAKLVLDYGFVDDLHSHIGSKVGKEFFIIAPAAKVMFLEDYIDKSSTRYYILRIPYSIINELHNKDFVAIRQPIDESQVNDTVDAVGFDFIRPPKVACDYCRKKPKGQLYEVASIKIKTFKSEAMLKGASQLGNLESLSMIMVDFNYKNKGTFNLDKVFYASDIEKNKWEVHLPVESFKDKTMVIYLDIYGNEYCEIKTLKDFKRRKK